MYKDKVTQLKSYDFDVLYFSTILFPVSAFFVLKKVADGTQSHLKNNNKERFWMFDVKKFVPLCLMQRTTIRTRGKGMLTVISSKNNGKRILLSASLIETLKIKDFIKLGFIDDVLVVGIDLPGEENQYQLRVQGNKRVLYSAPVVSKIAEHMHLDFSDRTCYTFCDVQLEEYNSVYIALFRKDGMVNESKFKGN